MSFRHREAHTWARHLPVGRNSVTPLYRLLFPIAWLVGCATADVYTETQAFLWQLTRRAAGCARWPRSCFQSCLMAFLRLIGPLAGRLRAQEELSDLLYNKMQVECRPFRFSYNVGNKSQDTPHTFFISLSASSATCDEADTTHIEVSMDAEDDEEGQPYLKPFNFTRGLQG